MPTKSPTALSGVIWTALAVSVAIPMVCFGRPTAPQALCNGIPTAAQCNQGQPACSTCHTIPPALNPYGIDVSARLDDESDQPFEAQVEAIVQVLSNLDSDGDGFSNLFELTEGTEPGDARSVPNEDVDCSAGTDNPTYDVCNYDTVYAFRRVSVDVCGVSPTYEELSAFRGLPEEAQLDALHEKLDTCQATSFWRGRDGVLWRLAHEKIRPLQAIKSGANGGDIPLADYDNDYPLFVFSQIDDNDARDALTADYYVRMTDGPPLRFEKVPGMPNEELAPEYRAGLLTTRWFFVINTMFTPLPRTTAAQAYRAYLGLDIAKSEGLIEPADEVLVDYDEKGITEETCAVCHRTLDPLSYPFSRYNGIFGLGGSGNYDPDRLENFLNEGDGIGDIPERGYLFGQRVNDLVSWAQVAAGSEAFAQATVRRYWKLLIGNEPSASQTAVYELLWRDFMDAEQMNYRVSRLLHALIETEAYGVP